MQFAEVSCQMAFALQRRRSMIDVKARAGGKVSYLALGT